eukprot:810153-Pyramimonas_sp.AAC.1
MISVNIGLTIPVVVVSVYLHISIGPTGANVDRLAGLLHAVGSLPSPWIIGTEWNQWNLIPEDMQEWAAKAKTGVVYSGEPTFGARELDYF